MMRRFVVVSRVLPMMAILIVSTALIALTQMTEVDKQDAQLGAVPTQQNNGRNVRLPWHSPRSRAEIATSVTKMAAGGYRTSPLSGNPPLFLPPVTYDPGGEAMGVAFGDVNGDGNLDVVSMVNYANTWQSAVAVLLGNGDGTLQPTVTYDAGGYFGWSVAVADVNGDSKPDLVAANNCGDYRCQTNGSVAVLLGNGNGTFRAPVTYDSGGYGPFAVAVADVNGDGHADILVTNCSFYGQSCGNTSSAIGVLLGNGDGTFQAAVPFDSGGDDARSVVVADVNGDGKADLLVGNGGNVAVLLGNGDGSFQTSVTYDTGGFYASSVAVGDLNRDGNLDLVVANECADSNCQGTTSLDVLLGNGNGTFRMAGTYPSSTEAYQYLSIAVADLNKDGKQDVLVAATDGVDGRDGLVDVFLGNGDGTLQPPIAYDSGAQAAVSIAVADLNKDLKPEALVADECGPLYCPPGAVSVLLNNAGAASTTTTLVSSPNPAAFGQTVMFTASVSSRTGTPTGTVTFFDGPNLLASRSLVNGSASILISSLVVGSHSISAAYQGTLGYAQSTSDPINQTVIPATTTTSLVSSINPVPLKEYVTYTASMTGEYGGLVTGTVTFQDGSVVVAIVPINAGKAVFTTRYTITGTHNMSAIYSGDGNNAGSASAILNQSVIKGLLSKTVLVTSGSPSYIGQSVTFTATVTSTVTIPDGEIITFYDGTTAIASVALTGQIAAYTTSSLSPKTHNIEAYYPGDATFQPSTGTVKQVVLKYPTTTTLVSSPNPSSHYQAVTFTATVTPSGPYPITGWVRFWDGTIAIGSKQVYGGMATLNKSTLAIGTHAITAQYLGDSYNAKNTSNEVDQIVQ